MVYTEKSEAGSLALFLLLIRACAAIVAPGYHCASLCRLHRNSGATVALVFPAFLCYDRRVNVEGSELLEKHV
jgi:hypothetical protein